MQQSPRLWPFWMVRLETLTVALVNGSMSWLNEITLSTLVVRFARSALDDGGVLSCADNVDRILNFQRSLL